MNPDVAWPIWSRERAQRIESALESALPAADESPRPLHAAMRYAVLDHGMLRVLPQRHGTDGAFAARLRRVSA